jgi:hypothetical protein
LEEQMQSLNALKAEGRMIKELDCTNNSQGICNLASLISIDDHVVMESTGPIGGTHATN